MCRFWVTEDIYNVQDPRKAIQFLLDHNQGSASLGSELTPGPLPKEYTFPDNSVLVMIGETDELQAACAAASTTVDTIQTAGKKRLSLRYVRINVGTFMSSTKTLIVLGAEGLLQNFTPYNGHWHRWAPDHSQPEYLHVTGWDDKITVVDAGARTNELPRAIKWIKENDANAWVP